MVTRSRGRTQGWTGSPSCRRSTRLAIEDLWLPLGRGISYLLSQEGDDLVLFVGSGEPCDATGAPVVEFDPPLAVPSPITEDSLVLPDEGD